MDKLIVHQTQDPNDVHNKLWFNDTGTNSNGTINTLIKVKGKNGTYKTLYPESLTKNIFLDEGRSKRLDAKLTELDNEDKFIHSKFLQETMNLITPMDNLLPRSKQQSLMTLLDPSEGEDIMVNGIAARVNGTIIV